MKELIQQIEVIAEQSQLSNNFKNQWSAMIEKIYDSKTPEESREELLKHAISCGEQQIALTKNFEELKSQVDALKLAFGTLCGEIKKTHEVVLGALAHLTLLEIKTQAKREPDLLMNNKEIVYH